MGREVPADELAARRLAKERAIKEAKRRLKQETSDDADLTEKQLTNKLCMELADLIGGGVLGFKCHVYEDEKGVRRPLIEDNNRQVSFVDDEKIKSAIFQHVRKKSTFDTRYLWNIREIDSCFQMWMKRTEVLRDIKPFDWLSGEGLTFRRLPFDCVEKDAYIHPTWDEITRHIEIGKDHFINFIGSIFVPESYRQQYLWVQGTGGDGKGTLLGCLQRLLGDTQCVQVDENIEDRFWAENLDQGRVAYFDDCKNTTIPTSKTMLKLTGGTTVLVEKKGVSKFTVPNRLKFIFTSNYFPSIQSINRDTRRGIIVSFKRKDDVKITDPVAFETAAWQEFPEFVMSCVASYRKSYPNHGAFTLDESAAELMSGIGAETDMNFQNLIDQFFELEAVEKTQGFPGQDKLRYLVKDTRLSAYLAEAKVARKDMGAVRRWLGTRWGITLTNTETAAYGKGNYYKGIREKYPQFSFSEFNPYRHGAVKR